VTGGGGGCARLGDENLQVACADQIDYELAINSGTVS
jgi:hypothetical protein